MIIILATLLTSFNVYSDSSYIKRAPNDKFVCDNTYVELKNTPPIKSQGAIGLCYAFSTLALVEHLKCSSNPGPRECYSNNRGSPIDMASKYLPHSDKKNIQIGGDPYEVLRNFSRNPKLVPDSCTRFENWKSLSYNEQFDDYFHSAHEKLSRRASTEQIECIAQDLYKKDFGDLESLMAIVKRAPRMTVEDFRSELLYKKPCNDPMVSYPEFNIRRYPERGNPNTDQGYFNFVSNRLAQNQPIEASFCAGDDPNNCEGHSVIITGIRNVCSKSRCYVQYKIQNSYGLRWQQRNDDGWVDATEINDRIDNSQGFKMIAISPKNEASITEKKYNIYKTGHSLQKSCSEESRGEQYSLPDKEQIIPKPHPDREPIKIEEPDTEIEFYSNQFDESDSKDEYEYPYPNSNSDSSPSNQNSNGLPKNDTFETNTSGGKKYKIYRCVDANGSTHMSDRPMQNMTCKGM